MANILTYTEQFNNAVWAALTTPGWTVTADSTNPPSAYGGNASMADTIEDASASVQCVNGQDKTKLNTDTNTYLASVFVLKDAITSRVPEFRIQFRGVATVTRGMRIETNTGTVGDSISFPFSDASKYGCVDCTPDPWWRVWWKFADPNANTTVRISIIPVAAGSLGVGDNATLQGSIVVWGANLIIGETLTEYEPDPTYSFGSALSIQLWEVSQ